MPFGHTFALHAGGRFTGVDFGQHDRTAQAALCGYAVQEVLRAARMAVVNSFWWAGETFYPMSGSPTKIDYLAVPSCRLTAVTQCNESVASFLESSTAPVDEFRQQMFLHGVPSHLPLPSIMEFDFSLFSLFGGPELHDLRVVRHLPEARCAGWG